MCQALQLVWPILLVNVAEINGKLDVIISFLAARGLDTTLLPGRSPIELSTAAYCILDEIGGRKYVNENGAALISIIESKRPMSGFDVQNQATVLMAEKIQGPEFVDVRNYMFQNPRYRIDENRSVSLDLLTVAQLAGIYLRDKYFEKYPALRGGPEKRPAK